MEVSRNATSWTDSQHYCWERELPFPWLPLFGNPPFPPFLSHQSNVTLSVVTQTPGFCGGDRAPHCNPKKHRYQCLPCWCQSLAPQSVTQIDCVFPGMTALLGMSSLLAAPWIWPRSSQPLWFPSPARKTNLTYSMLNNYHVIYL